MTVCPPLEEMHRGNYAVVPYVVPGKYVTYCFSYTGGALIQWCADTLAKGEKELAAREGLSVHAYLERQAAEPTGLLVLPTSPERLRHIWIPGPKAP